MKPLEMLTEVLRRANLSNRERESFEDMLDRVNRYHRCSDKQRAWIEKVYYGQKLDQQTPVARRRVVIPTWQKNEPKDTIQPSLIKAVGTEAREPVPQVEAPRQVLVKARPAAKSGTFLATPAPSTLTPHQIGYINYAGVQRDLLVTSLFHFEEVCPRIAPGSRQHQKVADFFARGGVVLKIKPLQPATQVA